MLRALILGLAVGVAATASAAPEDEPKAGEAAAQREAAESRLKEAQAELRKAQAELERAAGELKSSQMRLLRLRVETDRDGAKDAMSQMERILGTLKERGIELPADAKKELEINLMDPKADGAEVRVEEKIVIGSDDMPKWFSDPSGSKVLELLRKGGGDAEVELKVDGGDGEPVELRLIRSDAKVFQMGEDGELKAVDPDKVNAKFKSFWSPNGPPGFKFPGGPAKGFAFPKPPTPPAPPAMGKIEAALEKLGSRLGRIEDRLSALESK